jgi:hypothetical protein
MTNIVTFPNNPETWRTCMNMGSKKTDPNFLKTDENITYRTIDDLAREKMEKSKRTRIEDDRDLDKILVEGTIWDQPSEVRDHLLKIRDKILNADKTRKGIKPKNGVKIHEFEGVGSLYSLPTNKSNMISFKLVVPYHEYKANYFFRVRAKTKTIKRANDVKWLEVNYPGLLSRIEEVISNFMNLATEEQGEQKTG